MPVLPVIPNAFLIAQQTNGHPIEDHPFINRFCVLCTSSADRAAIADAFAAAFTASIMGMPSSDVTVGLTEVTPLDGTSTTLTRATPSFGTAGAGPLTIRLPWSLAFGITWQSAQRGRSHRGRSYIPGVDGSTVTDSSTRPLKPAFVAALQGAGDAFIAHLVAAAPSMALQVLSRKLGVATPVISSRANIGVVEQRRRYERVAHD
jgi:hypothetical protein